MASVVSDSQQPQTWQSTRLLRSWDFPGKSTGVGCHCLLPNFLLVLPIGRNLIISHLEWEFVWYIHKIWLQCWEQIEKVEEGRWKITNEGNLLRQIVRKSFPVEVTFELAPREEASRPCKEPVEEWAGRRVSEHMSLLFSLFCIPHSGQILHQERGLRQSKRTSS